MVFLLHWMVEALYEVVRRLQIEPVSGKATTPGTRHVAREMANSMPWFNEGLAVKDYITGSGQRQVGWDANGAWKHGPIWKTAQSSEERDPGSGIVAISLLSSRVEGIMGAKGNALLPRRTP